MAQAPEKTRHCPGDKATIADAICHTRQQRKYEPCATCEYGDKRNVNQEGAFAAAAAKIFKAYDIRGTYGQDLNEKLAESIGSATVRLLGAKTLAVGRDMRVSGVALADALIRGINLAGCDVLDLGLCSTDANYFATGFYPVDGGVQVTASHNPAQYNGFKISRKNAVPVGSDSGLDSIRQLALGPPARPAVHRGRIETRDVVQDFAEHVLGFAHNIAPMKIVIDGGNGMAGHMLPPILKKLPLEVIPLYFELDGTFPNHEANPLKPENVADLRAAVKKHGAAMGAAFDGDGDRCVFIDETGAIVPSDLVTAVLAAYLLKENHGGAVIYDVRSSRAVAEEIRKWGGVPVRERVGHAFIKATMRTRDAVLGGEFSGHYYFRDNYYADSGAIAFMLMLDILSADHKPLSHVMAPLKRYAQSGEINFEVEDKEGKLKALAAAFADGQIDYKDGITVEYPDWWFNVRISNTEPLLRLNLEAANEASLKEHTAKVEAIIKGK